MKRGGCFWAVVLVASAALVSWRLAHPPPALAARLPNGSLLTLRAVDYGTNQTYFQGSLWERCWSVVPARWTTGRSRGHRFTYQDPVPRLTVWLNWAGFAPHDQPILSYALADENGDEAEVFDRIQWASLGTGREIIGRGTPVFPRRSKTFTLRVYQPDVQGNRLRIAEFKIRNPVERQYPNWVPQPLPARARAGELGFVLTRLLAGVSPQTSPVRAAATNETQGVYATFRVLQGGEPSADWRVASLELSDATGNRVVSRSAVSSSVDGEIRFQCQPALWMSEPAWRMRVEFSREAGFAPDDLGQVQDIEVPAAGAVTEIGATTNLQGCRVTLHGIRSRFAEFVVQPKRVGASDRPGN